MHIAVARCRHLGRLAVPLWVLMAGACATGGDVPRGVDTAGLRARAESIAEGGVRVAAAVPTPEEARALFGVDLDREGIQPLWLEIRNSTDRRLVFLPTGLDPEYFSPREASFGFHRPFSEEFNRRLDEHFEDVVLTRRIPPDSTVAGFVFTNRDRGSKMVAVDLFGPYWTKTLHLVVPVPGQRVDEDHYGRITALVAGRGWVEVEDEERLRRLLERLPCCAPGRDGMAGGPLNFVLIGEQGDAVPAFLRRGYRYAPVSPWWVFGRPQDISARKHGGWVKAQPQILRAWLTDIRYRGAPVWIGQVSSPRGGRFAKGEGAEVGLDPDVDVARADFLQDLLYSQSLEKLGFVKGAGPGSPAPRGETRGYHTDGLRAVLVMGPHFVPLSGIGFFDWERLAD